MKKTIKHFAYLAFAVIGTVLLSCNKHSVDIPSDPGPQYDFTKVIGFDYDDPSVMTAEVVTKATAVTSLSSMYVSATKGDAGGETSKWTSTTFTSDGAGTPTYTGGKYWPDTDESYHFYASNNALTFAAAGTTVSANNGTDVVCAYMASPTYKSKNTLTFQHIFARIGNMVVSAASGYTISNVSIKITPKTGGTYNIRTGLNQTDATGWSSLTTGSATELANTTPGTKANDLYLVPGDYTLTASWRAVRGDYTHDYTDVSSSAVVSIEKGKVNNISVTLGGNATEISFGVSITAWDSANKTATFPTAGAFSVGAKTVNFAPGNLQAVIGSGPTNSYNYTASSWKFADHQWDYIGNAAGNTSFAAGTTVDLFGWVGTSASYNTYGLCTYDESDNEYYGTSTSDALKTDWGRIPGVISACGSGWRTLTKDEWVYLFNTRSASTVNGTANARYAKATINTDGTSVKGIILFPDTYSAGTPSGVTWGAINTTNANYTTTCTTAGFASLEAAGCVFLPAAGYRVGSDVGDAGSDGCYWSSTPYPDDAGSAYCLYFYSGSVTPSDDNSRFYGRSVRLVREF